MRYQVLALTLSLPGTLLAQRVGTPPPTKPPLVKTEIASLPESTEKLDLILLIGQSNMKGRGFMPEEPLNHPRIAMMHLKKDGWYLARHPLHLTGDPETFRGHDNAGVGPGLKCAETLIETEPGIRIGLIPAARGGSAIRLWSETGSLYLEAIRKAK
ncbi:MAG: sialate O-acetylesterase, partial [Verrucomicrobiota bacterium]